MASKTYSMLYQLSAQLASSFGSTFSKAQQSVAKMQQEVTRLNKVQGDISAYQKQQAAVEATKNKLAMLQQQYDNIQKEIRETGTYSSDLENKLLSKQAQIDKTNEKLQQQTDKLHTMGDALHEAGVDTDDLTKSSAQLEHELDELKAAQEEAAEGANGFGEAGTDAFVAVGNALVAAGIVAGLKEIGEAYMDCINLAGDFEETMSAVEAIAGADADGMAALTAEAKELGATTKFTAQQSGEAMTYMAMAGWDVNDMLNGMAGVMDLAAASGEDLSTVSDIVTDSLTAFGLTAEDSAHFSDVLAAAAANANTNVSIMGETFKASASIAGALGYSIEDVATAVGLMANSGVKGSTAGTALKNTFNGLLEGVNLTGKALGVYRYEAVKADGTMKSFGDTINELRSAFSQMTEAERVNNAMALAGKRGYNGLLAILNATDEEFESLTEKIYNCNGAAQQMAQIRMDNMKGELTLLQSAWEALRVTIGENFTGAMGGVYNALTKVTTAVNGFLQEHPGLIRAVTAFIGVIGAAVAGLTGYLAIVTAATKILPFFTGALGAAAGPIGWVVLGVSALAAGIAGLTALMDDNVPSVKELTEASRGLSDAVQEDAAAYQDSIYQTQAAANVAEDYISKLEQIEKSTHHHVEGNQEYHQTLQMLAIAVPELADKIDLETNSIEGGTAALRNYVTAWKEAADEQAKQAYLQSLMEDYQSVATELYGNQVKLTEAQNAYNEASVKAAEIRERMNELDGTGARVTREGAQEYERLQKELSGYTKEMQTQQKAIDNLTEAVETDEAAVKSAQETIDSAAEAMDAMSDAAYGLSGAQAEAAAQADEFNSYMSETISTVDELVVAYERAYEGALESFNGQFKLFDTATADADATVAAAQAALDSQLSYWQNYTSNISALKEVSAADLGVTQSNYDALMQYVQTGSEEAAGLAASMVQAINAGDTEAVANLANTIGEVQGQQQQAAELTADWVTDLSGQMDEMVQNVEQAVSDMELSSEAQAAAEATIQAYISVANNSVGAVSAAYAAIAAAASAALSAGAPTGGGGKPGGGGGLRQRFASGTRHANQGYALVGEEGPEILYMHGGEQVLPAKDTAELLTPGDVYRTTENSTYASAPISVSVTFAIDGNGPSASTLGMLETYGEEFAERVASVVREIESENLRRRY